MSVVMAERIRMIIDTDEDIRLAVRLAATKADKSVSEVVNAILRESLTDEIEDARRYLPSFGNEAGDSKSKGKRRQ